jgi:hypothetical protein
MDGRPGPQLPSGECGATRFLDAEIKKLKHAAAQATHLSRLGVHQMIVDRGKNIHFTTPLRHLILSQKHFRINVVIK